MLFVNFKQFVMEKVGAGGGEERQYNGGFKGTNM